MTSKTVYLFFLAGLFGAFFGEPLDVTFVFDRSRSVSSKEFKLSLEGAIYFVNKLDVGFRNNESRVGFVLFDSSASVEFGLTDYSEASEIVKAIRALKYDCGEVDIALGVDLAIRQVFVGTHWRDVPRILILLTEGADSSDLKPLHLLANRVHVNIFAIGVGQDVDEDQLVDATGDSERAFFVFDYTFLDTVFVQIYDYISTMPEGSSTVPIPDCGTTGRPTEAVVTTADFTLEAVSSSAKPPMTSGITSTVPFPPPTAAATTTTVTSSKAPKTTTMALSSTASTKVSEILTIFTTIGTSPKLSTSTTVIPTVTTTTTASRTTTNAQPAQQHLPRDCPCNYRNLWLDLLFMLDSSKAVGQEDFMAIRNLMGSFLTAIPISQVVGMNSRAAIINIGYEAHLIAGLKDFTSGQAAADIMRSVPFLNEEGFNLKAGLLGAVEIFKADDRPKHKNVVVIFSSNQILCDPNETLPSSNGSLSDLSVCQLAKYLRAYGTEVVTVALRYDGISFPQIDIGKPCFALEDDVNFTLKLINSLCQVNCYCESHYTQFVDTAGCKKYGECVLASSLPLDRAAAEQSCQDTGSALPDVLSAMKEDFVRDLQTAQLATPYWIGLSAEDDGVYRWPSGIEMSGLDYSNWDISEPDISAGVCVFVADGGWKSAECDSFVEQYYFSCQKNTCDTENYCA